jgi:hypothetical protein
LLLAWQDIVDLVVPAAFMSGLAAACAEPVLLVQLRC